MMRINSKHKESIQNLRVFTMFSVSSCNNTETHMSNYMVEVGPGGGGVTISMAVVAAAANRSKCMNLLFFLKGGSACISI